jgi:adenosylcobinamide kinase/adenosylcobinamide-phosphate guanylyltransferase
MRELIIGGVRSGKSRLAERLAEESGLSVTYIATATAGDAEMQVRIATHRAHRNPSWKVIEEPIALAQALRTAASMNHCIVVDCLTLWLTNLLCADDSRQMDREYAALIEVLPSLSGRIIFVTNETGMGVIPMAELARRFCDEAGRLHQAIAEQCDRVILTVAGLPHVLKGERL